MSEKVYGICENKCLKQVYTKEKIDNILEETVEITGSGGKAVLRFRRFLNVVEVQAKITLNAGEDIASIALKKVQMPEFAKIKNNGQNETIVNSMHTNGFSISATDYKIALNSMGAFRIDLKNGNYMFTGYHANGTIQENDTTMTLKGCYITDIPLEG